MTIPVVLASGSTTRRALLENAGVPLVADPADVDEGAIKLSCRVKGLSVEDTAETLAMEKALEVSVRHPGRIVLGADQMLECDGEWFDKPSDRPAATQQIERLSGRSHRLVSAVVAIRDGGPIWRFVESAELTMRDLSPRFIDSYLDEVGDNALSSVGGYQIEGPGIQLFSTIKGDHFTILGLPLLPLLDFLRSEAVIAN